MESALHLTLAILGWGCFGLAVVIGLAIDALGLFGNWIILLAVGSAAALTGFDHFDGYTLAMLLALAVAGEIVEAVSSGIGAARYGGGRGAVIASLAGAIIGAVLGTPWFPVVGTLVGACLGAFALATLYEILVSRRRWDAAARTGYGAAVGKIGGIVAKTCVGLLMLLIAFLNF